MTEDDTFLALSRPSLQEMIAHYRAWVDDKSLRETPDKAIERHGWGWQEFLIAWNNSKKND